MLAASGAPTWTYPLPIFVAVTSNGGDHGQRRRARDGPGAAGRRVPAARCSASRQFALGAVVSPLVGLGGEDSAVVPAVVMAIASALGFTVSRVGLRSSAGVASSSSTEIATS